MTTINTEQYNEFIKRVREFTIDGANAANILDDLDPEDANYLYNALIRPPIAAHARLARWTSEQLGFDVNQALEDALAD